MSGRPRRWSLLALPLVVPAALLTAAPSAEPGLVYEFRSVTTQGEPGASGKQLAAVAGRGQVAGGRARIDITGAAGPNPFTKEGSYVVVQEGGGRMLMVVPEEKQYFAFDLEQMLAGAGAALNAMGPLLKLTMSDVKIDVQDLGAGERLHGHDTRHLRMTQHFTMTVTVMGRKQVTTSADTMETWVAPALRDVVNPFLRVSSAAGAIDFGNPDYRRQLLAANEKLGVGLPLRSVARSVATDEKGKQQRTSMTVEVTRLERADVPTAAFTMPDGYAEVPSPMAALAAVGDSTAATKAGGTPGAAADAAKTDAPDAAALKEAADRAARAKAAEEAKKRVRGIFRRPPALR